ncbi:MAG: response regulator [Anaerolineales bacterium]|nr:response regulator [Anaerolineales bacterium]
MSKAKILLAEDDPTMVSLLNTLLKMEGFDVVTLEADEDALAVVRTEKPDVVLLDVHLLRKSGLDILDSLRRSKDASDARVVMTSGSSVKDECMRRGANDFLLKPYMPDDLIAILKKNMPSV